MELTCEETDHTMKGRVTSEPSRSRLSIGSLDGIALVLPVHRAEERMRRGVGIRSLYVSPQGAQDHQPLQADVYIYIYIMVNVFFRTTQLPATPTAPQRTDGVRTSDSRNGGEDNGHPTSS